ncbi:MAG: 23S rRNA methyltransferase [Gammaproteobacteria bacterium RIFCSPHIGHO2_02_FULL_42_13]|nr:MAG: 23S rRNA methyltransferase [Gammaproteobacteria bacterium RIFCSPHIGHO2_02_FULL_42_13]OGT69947.1 MAG: 23S rRNA methyltransferase [Gammaproteobacteria bacterium RIFCSPLOWO2_02_FULL_42_9]
MTQSKSSKNWLTEHFKDGYVKQAKDAGYRARSAYKLLEIQKKDHLIKPGMVIVDLGAAPGGWSQVAVELLKGRGQMFALDILPMEPISGVDFIQGDFTDNQVFDEFLRHLDGRKVDLVLSDMAPNLSGISVTDQARSIYLAELALDFAERVLKPEGKCLTKVFQGAGLPAYRKALEATFKKVVVRKPKASRDRSAEIYLLGTERERAVN